MKRGRPVKRVKVRNAILEILSDSKVPLTILSIKKKIKEKFGVDYSWNTIKKYLEELVFHEKVKPLVLPHSRDQNKKGLTLYSLK